MDVSNLIRDPKKVVAAWHSPKDSKTIIAKQKVSIYFPKHYMGSRLGWIDDKFNVLAIMGIVVDEKWFCASDSIAKMSLTPETVNVVKIEDVDYYELSWEPGSIITPNRFLIVDKSLLSEVSNEFVEKGKTPWYLNLQFMANVYKQDIYCTGVQFGEDRALVSLTASFRARHPTNVKRSFRHLCKDQKEFDTVKPIMTALNSVASSASNTTTRLGGGYMPEGMVSAIVDPTDESSTVEGLLLN